MERFCALLAEIILNGDRHLTQLAGEEGMRKTALIYVRRSVVKSASDAEAWLSWLPNERTTRDLLARIDHMAEVIATGTPRQQKEIMNTLFERIEQRDEQIERFTPQSWARGFL